MADKNLWVLPDGVNEITLELATPMEKLRRKILDEFAVWGYDLVFPPLIEFLDSILTGSSSELDLQTFKLTDQLSGRQMGVRADMTPQVARIDAHVRKKDEPDRLCYLGPVLRAKAHGVGASRTPIQLGAELFGHSGLASDIEIVRLMLKVLKIANITEVTLDIGHVGVFRAIIEQGNIKKEVENNIRDILQRKAINELENYLADIKFDKKITNMLLALPNLYGDSKILEVALDKLGSENPVINKAVGDMRSLADSLGSEVGVNVVFDLAELRGYSYHTGLVFAAFVEGKGSSIAKGGRYDEIGKSFGRPRPATGFSADLVELVRLSKPDYFKQAIFAPALKDEKLDNKINELRQAGEVVICELKDQHGDAKAMGCNRALVLQDGVWQIQNLV